MRFGDRQYRITIVIISMIFSLPILMHVINGLNSRMLADDFCFAANVQGKGWADAMQYYYYNWQGTYSSTGVQSGIALLGSWSTGLLPAFLIIGWWTGLYYLIWQLCQILGFQSPRLSGFALATIILFAIMEGTPSVFQTFYWTSGSVTYALPMVLFTLWCGVILHISQRKLTMMLVLIVVVIAGVTAAMMAGFSPIFAVFALEVIALIIISVWFLKPERKLQYLVILGSALFGTLIGTVIMVLAPGNAVRQALYEKPSSLLALIQVNITATGSFIGIDLSTFSLLPHLILLMVGGWIISSGIRLNSSFHLRVRRHSRRWLFIAFCITLILLFGIFLPTSYNISGFPPGRALVIPHVVMVGLTLSWGAVMALTLKKPTPTAHSISVVMMLIIIISLILGPLSSTLRSASLSPKFVIFSSEWDARDNLIRAATKVGNNEVTTAAFSVDLADYVNVGSVEGEFLECVQDYYGVPSLIIEDVPEA